MTCPKCKSTNVTAVELRGVYDGVCYWLCEDCDKAYHRFPASDYRHAKIAALAQRRLDAAPCTKQSTEGKDAP